MNRTKTEVTRAVALAALMGGGGACAGSEETTPTATGNDPVEAAIANLGVPIVGCDGSGMSVNGSGFASNTLTLNVGVDPLVLSAAGGTFSANGIKCTQTVSGAQKPLKTSDVNEIHINGDVNDNKVILDFLPGTFGTKVLSATGGITVNFNAAAGGDDSLMLRATTGSETYRFAYVAGAMGQPDDIYVDMTGDKSADIDLKPGTSGTIAITASMGAGNDTIIGNTPAADITGFHGSMLTVLPLPAKYGLTAYGGAGDDKFTGGLGNDEFYGGDGTDKFYALTTLDGDDVYAGDDGDDSVDYSGRSGAMKIDLGPVRAAVEGATDLRNPNLYGASGLLAGTTLAYVIDGKPCSTTFSTAPTTPADVLSAINTATNAMACMNTMNAVYASLNGKNHLVLMSNTTSVTDSFVKVETDPALGVNAGGGAETLLGLSTGAQTLPVSSGDLSVATLYTGTAMQKLDTRRLLLRVNGVYAPVVFNAPTSATDVLAQINSAINTALGTTGRLWATTNANNQLVLNATTLSVVAGATALTAPAVSAGPLLGFAHKVEGSVDMTTAGLFGAGGTLDTKTVSVVIDGARVETTLAAPADAAAVVTAINTTANQELGTVGVSYARVNAANHLEISSARDIGGVSAVRLVGDPAVAAPAMGAMTVAAETLLGLTANYPGATRLVGVDLGTTSLYGMSGTLADAQLTLVVDGTYVQIPFTTPADEAAVLAAINGAIQGVLGGSATYATKNTDTNKLEIASTWVRVVAGIGAVTYTSANATLGLTNDYNAGVNRDGSDADDGLVDEHDDVRYTIENITSGSGDDVIVGNDQKNTLKAGAGNDVISGGANGATCAAADGDTLLGEAGNDTFVLAAPNCRASLTGGDGDNTADFSGRSLKVTLKNAGTADSGETSENVKIGSDIKTLVGGFFADELTGGSGDDTLIGGPGGDVLTGGAGEDTVSYAASPLKVGVTLCFGMSVMGCGAADDGAAGEADQVFQIEHLIGSPYNDNLSAATATSTIDVTIEGGAGDDILTGGAGGDTLFGDAGDDTLTGGAGDDRLQGDLGEDALDGGNGSADICLNDAADLIKHPKLNCEL